MSSRTRKYIGDQPMWRGVWVDHNGTKRFTGPYDTPGKAKGSVSRPGSWIEVAEPVWEKVEGWERA